MCGIKPCAKCKRARMNGTKKRNKMARKRRKSIGALPKISVSDTLMVAGGGIAGSIVVGQVNNLAGQVSPYLATAIKAIAGGYLLTQKNIGVAAAGVPMAVDAAKDILNQVLPADTAAQLGIAGLGPVPAMVNGPRYGIAGSPVVQFQAEPLKRTA